MAARTQIMLCNFIPHACPSCGLSIIISSERHSDFLSGATFKHPCGLFYAFADETLIVVAADIFGGDMLNHVGRN